MDLLNKVKPTQLDDILFFNDQIKNCIQWLDNFKTKKVKTKNILLLLIIFIMKIINFTIGNMV